MKAEPVVELDPAAEPIVATSDELEPVKALDPNAARLALFEKSKKQRQETVAKDAEDMPDVAALQKVVNEAAEGGDEIPEFNTENRPDRFADGESDDPEYVEVVNHEDEEVVDNAEVEEGEEVVTEPVLDPDKPDVEIELDYKAVDGRVKAVINGAEYDVPEADIAAAGGLVQYQRQRAASIALEQVATQARALSEERKKEVQQQPSGLADGEPPATGALDDKATLEDQRKEVLKAVLDGDEDELTAAIENIKASVKPPPEPTETGEAAAPETHSKTDAIVEDYEQIWQAQVQEANAFLTENYPDVVGDKDLQELGNRKFKEFRLDPQNRGRHPVDIAREAGEFVRSVATRGAKKTVDDVDEQLELRRVRKRVLPKTSQAQQRTTAEPKERTTPSARDHIKALQTASGQNATRKR